MGFDSAKVSLVNNERFGIGLHKLPIDVSKLNPHRRAAVEMLEALPRRCVCAEIGVNRGVLSSIILEISRPITLFLVDPWQWSRQWFGEHSEAEKELMAACKNTP